MWDSHELPLGQETIKEFIPQREPFLFLDRVIALSENTIRTESDVSPDADFFKGHFPGNPIMPGVLIIETTAQAAALLVGLSHGVEPGKFLAFSGVDGVKFRRPVYPNETICVDIEIEKKRLPFYRFDCKATVGGELAASVKILAALMDHG